MIKDNYEKLITESKEVLSIWAAYYEELLNEKRSSKLPRTPEIG